MSNLAHQAPYKPPVKREMIDGVIRMMSPGATQYHNFVTGNLIGILRNYLRGKSCRLYVDGMKLKLNDENLFYPDIMVVCDESKRKDPKMIHGAPDLVVEVLSPRTTKFDRGRKKEIYEESGVKEFWLVDPSNLTMEVFVLVDGVFKLIDTYALCGKTEIEDMEASGEEIPKTNFKVSIFDDLEIDLWEAFEGIYEEVLHGDF
ncbi:MAG: Uma2 family endonuclease [Defluviitaleaceae bacterium]|nr:Uma2 family endonuclease [Defluviitaleaceae bacterium]